MENSGFEPDPSCGKESAEYRLRRFERVIQAAGQAIYFTNEAGVIEYVNPAFTEMTGFSPEEAIGQTPSILKSGLQDPEYYRRLWEVILSGQVWREEVANRRKDGSIYYALQTIASFTRKDGSIEGFAAIQIDISQSKHLERELIKAAETDYLTGLANRRKFYEILGWEEARSARFGSSFSLLIFDIDHFKRVNDRFGHDAGDRVLREASRRVAARLRNVDSIARWGGEEFVVLAPGTKGEDALGLAEALRKALGSAPYDGVGTVTASFGVACAIPGEDTASLVKRADEALYQAKALGRNKSTLASAQ